VVPVVRDSAAGAMKRPAPRHVVALLALVLGITGCFTVEGTLNADGSGSLVLRYRFAPPRSTATTETARFSSPDVTVRSVVPDGDMIRLEAQFTDVTRLSSARGFGHVRVRRYRRGASEVLRILLWEPLKIPDDVRDRMQPARITIHLPGRVSSASEWSDTDAATVAWTIPATEFVGSKRVRLTVRYAAPPRAARASLDVAEAAQAFLHVVVDPRGHGVAVTARRPLLVGREDLHGMLA